MKNISVFLSESFQFFVVKFSIYLNRRVFVMICSHTFTFKLVLLAYLDKPDAANLPGMSEGVW